jgi:two-component system alkaline phosphatase synthesis response regulator PhoP
MIKVAIIEDDLNLRSMYTFKLEQAGFVVKTANDGQEGLELVKEFNPDIVLLDLMMPIMPGDEMLAHMRAEDWGSSTRVIILTNISKDEAPQALRFLHVDRYIVKAHYTPTQVLEVVREVLHVK